MDRTYSERGQLATIAFNGTTIDTRTYDDGGRMLTSSYNNGVSESRTYNIDNTLASINFAGAPIGNLTYGWDANKNKTTETIAGTMSGYGFDATTYDIEDRLVSWNRADNALDQSWNLSLVGDWNSVTENTSVQVRTHGPTHELLTAAGAAVQHDAKGNQTLIPPALRPTPSGLTPTASRLKWDFENKLIAADTNDDGTDDVFYKWDALGRRVGRIAGSSSTVYVQDGQQTIADYTLGTAATTPTYNYVYASYIDEPVMRTGSGNSIYFHRNQQYSITALTNASGTITERYGYSAYGTPTILSANLSPLAASAKGNRYNYTGREYDETLDLYYYRARIYDSASGRLCSRDPIGFDSGSFNAYEYVASRPINNVDPSGLVGGIPTGGPGAWPQNLQPTPQPPSPQPAPDPVEIEEEDEGQLVCNYYSRNPYPVVIKSGSPLHKRVFNYPNFGSCREKASIKAGEVAARLGNGDNLGCWDTKSGSDSTLCKGVNNTGAFYALGKSRITVTIECTLVGFCFNCTNEVSPLKTCKIKYSIRDWFRDPIGVGIEPGGTPYPIDGDWEENWGGCPGYLPAFE